VHQRDRNQSPVLHTAAYWLLPTLRGLAPTTSFWRRQRVRHLRLAFVKIRSRVTERVTRINQVSLRRATPTSQSSPHLARRAVRRGVAVRLDEFFSLARGRNKDP
jgi:hypothetical protein